jgi:catechol 2,3-dioxygenase-like lactoylglutathione lyase family enzyme
MVTRREFLAFTSAVAVIPHSLWADIKVPTMLDHLLLGCSDLDQGIAFVEQHTGVRPAMGGVHPGRGTRNALLSLGVPRYLEVIAPDPAQTEVPKVRAELPAMLKQLTTPTLVDWAVHTLTIDAVAEQLRQVGIAFHGPTPGSRARPDGMMLHWQTLNLDDDHNGLLPFFIQWGGDTVHPSVDAPRGCLLDTFAVAGPNPGGLSTEFQKLGIDVRVEQAANAHLRAVIEGPKGTLTLCESHYRRWYSSCLYWPPLRSSTRCPRNR